MSGWMRLTGVSSSAVQSHAWQGSASFLKVTLALSFATHEISLRSVFTWDAFSPAWMTMSANSRSACVWHGAHGCGSGCDAGPSASKPNSSQDQNRGKWPLQEWYSVLKSSGIAASETWVSGEMAAAEPPWLMSYIDESDPDVSVLLM